jgi:phosphohistidine phosphatase
MIPGSYSLAHKLITGWLESSPAAASSNGWLGDAVPQVAIDSGVFKYVLLRLSDIEGGSSKLLVRGAAAAAYHDHVLQHARKEVQHLSGGSLQVEVLGGGRIEHQPDQGIINVYGYSSAFGPAVHEVTVGLLQRWYPLYAPDHITCSYEGY